MEYRVDEVGALIFKPREEDKPTVESLREEIASLREEIKDLKNEIKELSKRIAD